MVQLDEPQLLQMKSPSVTGHNWLKCIQFVEHLQPTTDISKQSLEDKTIGKVTSVWPNSTQAILWHTQHPNPCWTQRMFRDEHKIQNSVQNGQEHSNTNKKRQTGRNKNRQISITTLRQTIFTTVFLLTADLHNCAPPPPKNVHVATVKYKVGKCTSYWRQIFFRI